MKKKLNLRDFAILQLVVLIYTSSTVISKNRGAVRGERKRMDIFAALRSRNRSAGHLRALLAAGHQTGGTVCGVCESGDGAFMVTFVGGITVRGADYGEKTHRCRTGACRDADYQRRKGAGKS